MIDDNLYSIRFFFRRLRNAKLGTLGKGGVFVAVSAALLSSIASGQVPTTTALPYLLTNQPGVVYVAPSAVIPVPPAVTLSGFGGLLGGGLSSIAATPSAAAGETLVLATVHKLLMMKIESTAVKMVKQADDDTMAAQRELMSQGSGTCNTPNAVKSHHRLKAADSPTCTLPEEEEAQEAEEELQSLNEAGDATQEAIEAAEVAAEAAETAAEEAEAAAEAIADGLDVAEALLDALSLF
jgi:hypothetical protein